MRPIIYPYKMGSRSGKVLAQELDAKRVFPDRNYKNYASHLVINWGNSQAPTTWATKGRFMLNKPLEVLGASNKLTAFETMKEAGVSIPEFTDDPAVARGWIIDEGTTVVSRYSLTGHSGNGIVLCDDYDKFIHSTRAPLYVKYIKKKAEYRVHVFNGKVIDVQQKRKKKEVSSEEVDYQVRNYANGWVYCRDDVSPDQSVIDNAILAVDVLGLDFGAVDVIWNDHYAKAYVLEVNTAPGLEGQTLTNYANAIKELL